MSEKPTKSPISPQKIELVQKSWAAVLPISDAAATLFYNRLFTLEPSLRSLFKNDIEEQKRKLMQTLGVAVDGLKKSRDLIPVLEKLGVRHVGYMVQEHHYDLVGEALIWTLQEGLGEKFTPEVSQAWKEVYQFISGVMKRAAARSLTPLPASLPESAENPSPARPTPEAPAPRKDPAPPRPKASKGVELPAAPPFQSQPVPLQLQLALDPDLAERLRTPPPPNYNEVQMLKIALPLSLIGASLGALGFLAEPLQSSGLGLLGVLGVVLGLLSAGFLAGTTIKGSRPQ